MRNVDKKSAGLPADRQEESWPEGGPGLCPRATHVGNKNTHQFRGKGRTSWHWQWLLMVPSWLHLVSLMSPYVLELSTPCVFPLESHSWATKVEATHTVAVYLGQCTLHSPRAPPQSFKSNQTGGLRVGGQWGWLQRGLRRGVAKMGVAVLAHHLSSDSGGQGH